MKKNIEWLKDEILTDMRYLEGNREIQQLDIKYQTLREVAQKINSLDEPETLSQDWINKHKREHDEYPSGAPVLLVDDVKEAFLNKEMTEDQAWNLLKDKYEWPWDDLRYTVMQQLEEGTAEAKMANLGYFEVEVDGVKHHVHEDAHTRIYDEAYEQGRGDLEREQKIAVPVIPQVVADCLEHGRKQLEYSMYDFMHFATHLDEVKPKWKEAYEWIQKNTDKFAEVYLKNEYKVEKEPKYFVKVNGKYLSMVRIEDRDSIGSLVGDIEILYEVSGHPHPFTKKEVEYLERYLNIEVTEVKPLPF